MAMKFADKFIPKTIMMPIELEQEIQKVADENNRSFSSQVIYMLKSKSNLNTINLKAFDAFADSVVYKNGIIEVKFKEEIKEGFIELKKKFEEYSEENKNISD